MPDTKITRLRNLLTPVKNYFAMVNADNSGQSISTLLLDRELVSVNENMGEILRIIEEIPDDAIDKPAKKIDCGSCQYKNRDEYVAPCYGCRDNGRYDHYAMDNGINIHEGDIVSDGHFEAEVMNVGQYTLNIMWLHNEQYEEVDNRSVFKK